MVIFCNISPEYSHPSYKLEYEAYEKRRNEEIRVEEAIRKKEERNIKRREYKYWSSLDPYEFERVRCAKILDQKQTNNQN